MNILLLGKGGQVGWELQRSLSVLGNVTALDFDRQDRGQRQQMGDAPCNTPRSPARQFRANFHYGRTA